jgi:hypothetical protein
MKRVLWVLALLLLTVRLFAQTNLPIKLALIAEMDEVAPNVDILTATLSGGGKVQLLERDEIEKVYREQGMTAANRDDLKIGRILGADGLLLLNVVRAPQATNLTVRLIAVKPGVVLTDGSFPWPIKDTAQWAASIATYLNSFLPKLTVLAKDAVPISIVNLRAAMSSTDEQETERELKLLTIQRLSQERQFFVLERQKMQLLSEEKELNSDESAFWDSSYLLDGTIDQNGYTKDAVTINARLTPPKGGAPLSFVVNGSRTNLTKVVNRLATNITALLKVDSTVKEWNAPDEAAQYFDEAKWALRWGVYPEAQAAADSAWALGKCDMDCALVRIRAYETPLRVSAYQNGEFTNPRGSNDVIEVVREEAAPNPAWGLIMRQQDYGGARAVQYAFAYKFPDPKAVETAIHALELYYQFSRNSSGDLLKVGSQENGWVNSEWYNVGIEDLEAASTVLQHFNFVPGAQESVADKLADLRAQARSVADWISHSPSVHDSYFVGDEIATGDELTFTIQQDPNLFKCEVDWGCFWQEHPKDIIDLYRKLMSSPVFCYIHQNLWLRPLERPRLVAWNEADQKRLPRTWEDFTQELGASSNTLLQLEAKAFQLADAKDDEHVATAFTNLFDGLLTDRDALVANNIEVLYSAWQAEVLVSAKTGNGIATDTRQSLNHLYYSEYWPKLQALDQEYRSKPIAGREKRQTFEKQKQYLKENRPYEFTEFVNTFSYGAPQYSKAQALEIKPLFELYKSNLVAESKSATGIKKAELMGAINYVGMVEGSADRALNPSPPPSRPQVQIQAPKPAPIAPVAVKAPVITNAPEVVTNVIAANNFFPIPWERLVDLNSFQRIEDSTVYITAHHWCAGKLLFNFEYGAGIKWLDEKGKIVGGSNAGGTAIAVFDPKAERWDVINCPQVDVLSQNRFYDRSAFFHEEVFNSDGGQIKKYDFASQGWEVSKISDGNNYELFVVNGHLYAADQNIIFEILDGGEATHILASTRRRPPMSVLDTQDWGTPILFEGPGGALRLCTSSKIFTWTGSDWREDAGKPATSFQPEISTGGVIFRQAGTLNAGWQNGVLFRQENGSYGSVSSQDAIYCLPEETNDVVFCLGTQAQVNPGYRLRPGGSATPAPKPLWEMPANLLPNPPAGLFQSELYLLEDAFAVHAVINDRHEILQEQVVGDEKYNAALLHFSPDCRWPQKVFLRFDPADAEKPNWVVPTADFILFGAEKSFGNPAADFVGGNGRKAGVWLIPVREIKNAVVAQKQVHLARMKQEKQQTQAAVDEYRKKLAQRDQDLLTKYDLNHDGIIDLEEREAALEDSTFIESELDTIDANHNNRLDAQELIRFDANRNGVLDPPEATGIDIAQKLLAEKLIKNSDSDGDGQLEQNEFAKAVPSDSTFGRSDGLSRMNFSLYDRNHDDKLDAEELKLFLEQRTTQDVGGKLRQMQPSAVSFLMRRPRPTFKEVLEMYWQASATDTNQALLREQANRTQTNSLPAR